MESSTKFTNEYFRKIYEDFQAKRNLWKKAKQKVCETTSLSNFVCEFCDFCFCRLFDIWKKLQLVCQQYHHQPTKNYKLVLNMFHPNQLKWFVEKLCAMRPVRLNFFFVFFLFFTFVFLKRQNQVKNLLRKIFEQNLDK